LPINEIADTDCEVDYLEIFLVNKTMFVSETKT